MKIGVLTFWKTEDNYGQLLQCYATVCQLKKMGHEPFLVRATNGREYNPNLKEQLIDKLRTAYRLKPYPIYFLKRAISSAFYTLTHAKLRKHIENRGFEDFRRDYLYCSEIYTLDELKKNPPKADAFIVGSDQIWNTTDGIYFLSWTPENVTKISLAASFGARGASDDFCNLISPWIKRFNLVTVREQSGIDICKEADRQDAVCVPDPTLMLRKDDYLKIASDRYPKEPYLFIYFLGTRTAIDWKQIHQFAKSKGLKIVYVGSQGQEDKYKKESPTISEWLSLMAHAEYVITNSFHGTIFAMQFHRKFMVLPVSGASIRMNDRLTTLLSPLGLTDRIYNGNLDRINEDIDYPAVFQTINSRSGELIELLDKNL